jgi:hypothetical protein
MTKHITVALGTLGIIGWAALLAGAPARPAAPPRPSAPATPKAPPPPRVAPGAVNPAGSGGAKGKVTPNPGNGGGNYGNNNNGYNGYGNYYDQNRNGNRDQKNNYDQYANNPNSAEGAAARIMRERDANRDNSLSFAEAGLTATGFRAVDSSGDGMISFNELVSFFRAAEADAKAKAEAAKAGKDMPAGVALKEGAPAPKEAAPKADLTLAGKVRKALKDGGISIAPINENTSTVRAYVGGKVILAGVVAADDMKDKALDLTKAVEGVTEVESEKLAVKAAPAKADAKKE